MATSGRLHGRLGRATSTQARKKKRITEGTEDWGLRTEPSFKWKIRINLQGHTGSVPGQVPTQPWESTSHHLVLNTVRNYLSSHFMCPA
jgi:hypothetical protein